MSNPDNEGAEDQTQLTTSLTKTAKKGTKMGQNSARVGSKDPASAHDIRKTARILGLQKRTSGATVTLHLRLDDVSTLV